MKKIILILALVLTLFMLTTCTIVYDRWVIDWDDDDSPSAANDTFTIDNNTGETIDTIKYYVGDNPPGSWEYADTINDWIPHGYSRTFSLGSGDADIEVDDGDTVWIRLSAETYYYSSRLFVVDGFTYGAAESDCWVAYVYKEK